MSIVENEKNGKQAALEADVVRRILEAIQSLHFGAVEVTVHDGRVVQIDKRERTRIGSTRI